METLFIEATAATGTLGPSNSKVSSTGPSGGAPEGAVLQQQILLMVSHFAPVPSLLAATNQNSAFSSSMELFFPPPHQSA